MSESLTDIQRQQIIESLYAGRKIQAIKIYRDATGAGLKAAKDFIESLEDALRAEDPNAFSASKGGCTGATAVLLIAIGVLTWICTSA